MLDLTRFDEREPYEHDDLIIFKEYSLNNWLVSSRIQILLDQMEEATGIVSNLHSCGFSIHTSPPPLGQETRTYLADFYLTGRSPEGRMADPDKWIKATKLWRMFSPDTVFHLCRYSTKGITHWLHFIITNSPAMFEHVYREPTK